MPFKLLIKQYFNSPHSVSLTEVLIPLFNHYRNYTLYFDKPDTDEGLTPTDIDKFLLIFKIEMVELLLHLENGDYDKIARNFVALLKLIDNLGLAKYYRVITEEFFETLSFEDKIEALIVMRDYKYVYNLSSLTPKELIHLGKNVHRFDLDSKIYIFSNGHDPKLDLFYQNISGEVNCEVNVESVVPYIVFNYISMYKKTPVICHRLKLKDCKLNDGFWKFLTLCQFNELELVDCYFTTIPPVFRPKIRTVYQRDDHMSSSDKLILNEDEYPNILHTTSEVIFTNRTNTYFGTYVLRSLDQIKNLPRRIGKLVISIKSGPVDLSLFDGYYFEQLRILDNYVVSDPTTKIITNILTVESFDGVGFDLTHIFKLTVNECKLLPPYLQYLSTNRIPEPIISNYLIVVSTELTSKSLYSSGGYIPIKTSYLPNLSRLYVGSGNEQEISALFTENYTRQVMPSVKTIYCCVSRYDAKPIIIDLDSLTPTLTSVTIYVTRFKSKPSTSYIVTPYKSDPRFKIFTLKEHIM